MRDFFYEALPMRVRFAAGSRFAAAEEIRALGLQKVIVLSTEFQAPLAAEISDSLGELSVGVFDQAEMHVPVETARAVQELAQRLGADGCVAVGGGSTTGLGKALALEFGMPIIAVPTTFAGSEMTPIWGLTENGRKKTGRDRAVLPKSVLYDPELLLSLPLGLCVTSGFNAIAHAVEGLYAPDASPIISLIAAEGVGALASALPAIAADPGGIGPRSEALYGAWLCGVTLGATTMSLHHKLCHVLGGTLDLPHAETHTVVLPHVMRFNLPAAPDAERILRDRLATDDPAAEVQRLSRSLGAPVGLAQLGMDLKDVELVVELAMKESYANPRPVTAEDVRRIVHGAWLGVEVSPVARS